MRKMPSTIALLAIAAFLLLAALLLLSNRGKTSPIQAALRALAAQTGGTYQRKAVGFGQVVEFEKGNHLFTFETASSLAGPGDASASYRSLRASTSYNPTRPFELMLEPKAAHEVVIKLGQSHTAETVLGIPVIDDTYRVLTSDPQMAGALLGDASVQRHLTAVAARTSRLAIGPHESAAWIAFGEEEEAISTDRLLAIRDLLTALLAALERNGLAVAS